VTRLFIWRHGQTEWNSSDRIQGHTDVALDDVGRAQAVSAATALARHKPDLIMSSDLRRAAETAATLAAVTGLPIHFDARLREQNFGTWQGMTRAEAAAAYPDDHARWSRGEPINAYGMEDRDDLAKRAAAAARDAVALADGGTVVLATHGGAAKYMLADMLGWQREVYTKIVGLANCHWTELRLDPIRGWVLRAHNVGGSLD
jgi:glucosyl-3-phosphoglycerate phosphatase